MHRLSARLPALVLFAVGELLSPPPAGAMPITVDAFSNIYQAGGNSSPYGGNAPPTLTFAAVNGRDFVFSVTGATNCGGSPCVETGPDGILIQERFAVGNLPLMGVFLDNRLPPFALTGPDFIVSHLSAPAFSPQLDEMFFIGDGLTGSGSGLTQIFHAPNGATQLALGVIDCCFGDNSGFYTVNATTTTPVPEPASLLLTAAGLAVLRRRLTRTLRQR